MLTSTEARQTRRRPPPSLMQQYQEYVLQRIEGFKNSIDRDELLRAVRPAALIASSSANIVKLQVGGDGSGLTVSATAEVGDYTGEVEGTVEGDATTIAFNAFDIARGAAS